MAGDYTMPQTCRECLSCIRCYKGICPGLVVFTREGCMAASEPWRKERSLDYANKPS